VEGQWPPAEIQAMTRGARQRHCFKVHCSAAPNSARVSVVPVNWSTPS
jgi:hypothetical protein